MNSIRNSEILGRVVNLGFVLSLGCAACAATNTQQPEALPMPQTATTTAEDRFCAELSELQDDLLYPPELIVVDDIARNAMELKDSVVGSPRGDDMDAWASDIYEQVGDVVGNLLSSEPNKTELDLDVSIVNDLVDRASDKFCFEPSA